MADAPIRARTRVRPARKLLVGQDDQAIQEAAHEAQADAFDLSGEQGVAGDLPEQLSDRVRHIGHFSREYLDEFVLAQLHEMRLARVPVDKIAKDFGVSSRRVYQWLALLREKRAEEARTLDPWPLYGQIKEHYGSIGAAAWRIAQKEGIKEADRVRALDVVLRAQDAEVRFLKEAGYLGRATLTPPKATETNEEAAQADMLKNALADILNGAVSFATIEETPDGEGEGA